MASCEQTGTILGLSGLGVKGVGMLLVEPRYVSDGTEVIHSCGITTEEEFFNELTMFTQFWLNF